MTLEWLEPVWTTLEPWWGWIGLGSTVLTVALVLASVVGLPRVLAGLPVDYLHREPPAVQGAQRVVRNLIGYLLVVLGVLMLVLPGQGLLTVLAGVLLADVPGKRRWILLVMRRPQVLGLVNAIRIRAGEPALDD